MHDSKTVAHVIARPWPQRSQFSATGSRGDGVRWRMRLFHDCGPWCSDDPPHRSGAFPWWKLSSYSMFWRVAGRDLYWPPLITIWHQDPPGRECFHRRRKRDGTWVFSRRWRWHVHHFRVQIHPLQHFRRWALTRCAWCHGRSRRGDLVNFGYWGGGRRTPPWRGETGLYHQDCQDIERAHRTCQCPAPRLPSWAPEYGTCLRCGRFYPWRYQRNEADRLLNTIPTGGRIPPGMRPALETLWAQTRTHHDTPG